MKQVTFEEALEVIRNNITQAYIYACYNKSTKQNTGVLEEQTHRMVKVLEEQHKPPTLEEVVKAWEQCYGNKEVVTVKQDRLSISVFYDGHRDFFINSDFVYWDEFPYKTVETHHAINITIRYLKTQTHHDL